MDDSPYACSKGVNLYSRKPNATPDDVFDTSDEAMKRKWCSLYPDKPYAYKYTCEISKVKREEFTRRWFIIGERVFYRNFITEYWYKTPLYCNGTEGDRVLDRQHDVYVGDSATFDWFGAGWEQELSGLEGLSIGFSTTGGLYISDASGQYNPAGLGNDYRQKNNVDKAWDKIVDDVNRLYASAERRDSVISGARADNSSISAIDDSVVVSTTKGPAAQEEASRGDQFGATLKAKIDSVENPSTAQPVFGVRNGNKVINISPDALLSYDELPSEFLSQNSGITPGQWFKVVGVRVGEASSVNPSNEGSFNIRTLYVVIQEVFNK